VASLEDGLGPYGVTRIAPFYFTTEKHELVTRACRSCLIQRGATTGNAYGMGVKCMSMPRRNKNIEDRNKAGTWTPLTDSTGLLDPDDGGPRTGGNVDESGDHHAVKLHSPLSKTPLFTKPVVEWEYLYKHQRTSTGEETTNLHHY
jgi:hypothetical protein